MPAPRVQPVPATKPVHALPGETPKSPVMMVASTLVTVVPAKTAKLSAVLRESAEARGASAAPNILSDRTASAVPRIFMVKPSWADWNAGRRGGCPRHHPARVVHPRSRRLLQLTRANIITRRDNLPIENLY